MRSERNIKKIEEALYQLDMQPLMKEFPIDLDDLVKKLSLLFEKKDFSITPLEQKWRSLEELKEGFLEEWMIQKIFLVPLSGELFWIMDKKEIAALTKQMMTEPPIEDLSSEFLQEGFYHFLCLHVLDALQGQKSFENFSLKLQEDTTLKENGYLTRDLMVGFQNQKFLGRLAFSHEFLKSLNHHLKTQPFLYQKDLEKNIEVTLSLIGGKTFVDFETFQAMEKGDFLLMDRLSFDPRSEKSLVTLSLGKVVLFHAKVKSDKIKILDYGLYSEETMQENPEEEIFEEEKTTKTKEEKLTSIEKFPLEICIELGRIRMPLSELLALQPGNFLELPSFDGENVSLVINGKSIGKAEIVHLGEASGVRILELEK